MSRFAGLFTDILSSGCITSVATIVVSALLWVPFEDTLHSDQPAWKTGDRLVSRIAHAVGAGAATAL
ncbi:hypothetical protein PsYK624_117680 [Phanerochaete sordida]|uniref:Uncharacterized protein n=1 Tax=Phanerochaete sordida TaxID=48140 RepID=A0A9P3GIA2_9APHY|nr:hypothetical protein PsYK624_117680 [Phanerochaete sordida]